jgi:hypothetical protein
MLVPRRELHHPPYSRLSVCYTCGRLSGDVLLKGNLLVHQQCHCCANAEDGRWPGYDFNIVAELCRCCGQVLLKSGNKFSVWFCDHCKENVCLLNGRLGRYAIPIGRHSLHGGFLLKPKEDAASRTLDIELFVARWNDIRGAMGTVEVWAGEVVRQILAEKGLDRGLPKDVEAKGLPVAKYLGACRPTKADKKHRFLEMLAFLSSCGSRRGQ